MTAVVEGGIVSLLNTNRRIEIAHMSYGHLIWRPDSSGFAIMDSEGSGQTSTVSYIDLSTNTPLLTTALREAAIQLFASANQCEGEAWYTNTYLAGWSKTGAMLLVVQDGVHSNGCKRSSQTLQLGVEGDPRSGVIQAEIGAEDVRRLWCTEEQRRTAGYCFADAGATRPNR